MGVHGLWKLIESSGKPIPIETLENKVLAVDVSIWLHQAIKGFQDSKGAPIANAHLLGLYHRVCKLIYFKIKPIFVFDGGVPALKRQTIAKRNQVKSRNASEADRLQKQLLSTLLKHSAVSKVLSEKAKASLPVLKKSSGKYDNLYVPSSSTEFDTTLSSSEDEDTEETTDSTTTDSSPTKQWDLHTIDTTSMYFKSLPLDVKHEILTELKETRKQNTWAKLHLIPKQSDDFSSYQMKRLLKRQEVQSTLDEVSKEMGGASLSLAELESLLKDQGIKTTNDSNPGRRIASDENTRYLYIKDLQEEIKKAEEKEQTKNTITAVDEDEELKQAIQLSLQEVHEEIESKEKRKSDLEEEEELKKAVQLSLEETPSTSVESKISKFSFLDNFNDADFISDSDEDHVEETITHTFDKPNLKKLSSAQSYMLEYSGLSRNEIDKIIDKNTKSVSKPIKSVVEKLPKHNQDKSNKIQTNGVAEHTKAPITINLEKEKYIKNNIALFQTEDIRHNSEVEIMSDSDDDSNDEIHLPNEEIIVRNETVSIKVLHKSKPLEIIIDPNKTADDDGLFDDIFDAVVDTAKEDFLIGTTEEMYKVDDPNKTAEDAGDIFYENKIKEDFQIGTTEEMCEVDKSNTGKIGAVEEDKILTIKEQTWKTIAVNRNEMAAKNKEVFPQISREEMEELKENLQTDKSSKIQTNEVAEHTKAPITINLEKEKYIKNNIALFQTEDIHNSEVEIMSDSDDEIHLPNEEITVRNETVSIKVLHKSKPLEIIIDPNKTADDDGLFDDIFDEKKIAIVDAAKEDFRIGTTEEMYKVDDPNKTAEDAGDIFDENKIKEDFQIGTTEEMCKVDKNNTGTIGAVEEDKILTIKEQTCNRNAKNKEVIPQISREEMEELKENLQTERIDLLREKATKERLASNITDQMYQDAQELLELFGVPYVVAPMEAEAQCAFLDEIELTNGTITDDSDIWLFGGKTVYKNFFNQSKYVMEYKSENIEHHFKLNRQQMILMALLVGSDYTTGVQGVGPVTALEILASFPPSRSNEFKLTQHQLVTGLKEFKSWFVKGKSSGPGRSGLKSKLKKITFTDGFPSSQVVEAYLEPKVDPSGDAFSWGKPDITGLTVFAKDKFGWTMKKTEEILKPVIKKMEENQTQKSIKEYFKTKFKISPVNLEGRVSKRVKIAIDKIGKTPEELIAEDMADLEKEKKRQIRKTKGGVLSVKSKSTNSKMKTQKNTDEAENKEDTISNKTENPIGEHFNAETTTKNKKEVAKRPRKTIKKKSGEEKIETACETGISKSLAEIDDIKDYENLAVEIKTRRKRRNELLKIKTENPAKKIPKIIQPSIKENIPKELEDDAEVKLLEATTSQSNKRVEQINVETVKSLEKNTMKKKAPIPTAALHTKEVIQQKLREKSNLLRNKLKAIEVYRKSTKGPGYVPKRSKKVPKLKEDAGLSEDSD